MAKAGNQWTFMPQVDSEGRLVLAHLTVRVLQPYQFTDGRYLAAGKAKSRCLKILGTLCCASQPSGLRSESEIKSGLRVHSSKCKCHKKPRSRSLATMSRCT